MRIGIDARSVSMLQRGMPVYAWNLLIRLPKQLPQFEFYYFINTQFEHNLQKEKYETRLEFLASFSNVQVIDIPDDAYMYWEQWLLYKTCKKYQIDLLHMPANRICLLYANKQIVTLHDAIEWEGLKNKKLHQNFVSFKQFAYLLRTYFYTYIQYKIGVKWVKRIVTISKYAETQISNSLPIDTDSINYIYHGIPDAFRDVDYIPIQERHGLLMLGGESHHKNPFNMLSAYAKLPHLLKLQNPLTIVGIAPQAVPQFETWIIELNIDAYVSLESWLDEKDLVEAFQQSKAFLFASKEEGFGFPLIQAMSTGTPVLISTCPVLIELCDGTMPSSRWDDVDGLFQQMLAMLSDESKLISLSDKALLIAKRYSWEHSVSQVAEIYQEA